MGPGGKENKREIVLSVKVSQEFCPNPEEIFAMLTVAGTSCPLSALGPHTLMRTGPWGSLHYMT